MANRKEYEMLFALNAQMNSGFSGTLSKAQGQFAKLGNEIQNLNKINGDISSYQKQQNALEATAAKLQNLRQQHDLLQKEIDETTGSTASLEREKLKLEQRIDDTEAALQREKQKLDATGDALAKAGVNMDDLAGESAKLTAKIDDLKEKQQEAADKAKDFGDSSVSAFEAVSSAIATAGVATALKEIADAYMDCVTVAADFEESMSTVKALSGASGDELEELTAKAKEMGATTKFTATESAEAFQYMALAGWDTGEMLDGIAPILNLATAANMDLAQASDIVTDYLTAFGLTASDSAGFVDQMAYAMSKSNTSAEQLGEAYKDCASTAQSMGYSVEDATAALMVMANAGVKGGEAGTALNAIMTRLATDTKGCASALEEYGVHVYDSRGNMQSLSSILQGISGVWATLNDEQAANLAKTIAGTNQYSKFQTIMQGCSAEVQATGKSFTDYAAALENCNGAADQMAETMLDNLNGELTLMQSAWDALKTTIGEQFMPEMRELYGLGTDVFELLNSFVEKHPAAVKAIATLVAGLGTIVTAIMAISAAIKVVKALNLAAMLTNPVFLAIAGVTTLTAAVVGAVAACDDATVSVKELTGAAQEMNDVMDSADSTYEDTMADTMAAASVADTYITKLEQMGDYAKLSAEDQQEYHNILALLCETVPSLADSIDLESNTIQGGTAALRANTDAWVENAKAQAYQEIYTSYAQAYSDVLVEQAKRSMDLTKAQTNLEAAQQKVTDTQSRMNELTKEATEKANAYNKANGTSLDYTEFLSQEYYDLRDSLSDLNNEVADAQEDVDTYTEALQVDGEAAEAAKSDLAMLDDVIAGLTGTQEEATDGTEGLTGALNNAESELSALADAYNEAYEAALESIQGQYDLWDQVAPAVATSAGEINAALESQISYWQSYNDNLQTLGDRAGDIEGLSEMIASFADGSTESVNAIAGMASASDEDLRAMVANWQALQQEQEDASGSLADLETDFSESMDQIQTDMEDAVTGMSLPDEATESARETIQAFIDKANGMLPQVQAAYRQLAGAASAALGLDGGSGTSMGSSQLRTPGMDGYASGTTNATPGYHLVGENGPELVNFRGGEQVITSAQTAAMLDRSGGGVNLTVSPVYQISGTADPDSLRAVLDDNNDTLRDLILGVIQEAQEDSVRRAYT